MKKNRVAIKRLILLIWAASVFSGENIISQTRSWQTVYFNNGPSPKSAGEQCLPGDFNGDGRTDIACYTLNGREWHVGLSPKTGTQWKNQRWEIAMPISPLIGDFNGDHLDDMVTRLAFLGGSGRWQFAFSAEQGNKWNMKSEVINLQPKSIDDQCFIGDFNGDGYDDIICFTLEGGKWGIAFYK